MSKLKRDTTKEIGQKYINDSWLLNVYTIRSNPNELIDPEVKNRLIEKHLKLLEKNNMSDEFDYYKIGFCFLHFGNRGVDLTIWHIGRWGTTFETFICSWYCYGRNIDNMEQLNAAEPMLCQYEMETLTKEIRTISDLVEYETIEELRNRYLEISGM